MQYKTIRRGASPPLTVVIIDSRSDKFPVWVKRAITSVLKQTYENIELLIIDNRNRENSIGKCRNFGIEKATGNWVLFLDDDDHISPDYVHTLVYFIDTTIDNNRDVVVSTFCTLFDAYGNEKFVEKYPIGTYYKPFFVNFKFNESLTSKEDIDIIKRVRKAGKDIKIIGYHFGYYYRQHEDMNSGAKSLLRETEITIKPGHKLISIPDKDFFKIKEILELKDDKRRDARLFENAAG